jgi:hypothetical protein
MAWRFPDGWTRAGDHSGETLFELNSHAGFAGGRLRHRDEGLDFLVGMFCGWCGVLASGFWLPLFDFGSFA